MRVVFWQNILSMHQAAHIRALAARSDCEVILVSEEESVPAWRKAMGWKLPDFGLSQIISNPTAEMVRDLIFDRADDTVHVFSGIAAYPLVDRAFTLALKSSARIGVLSEAPSRTGLKGRLRLLRAKGQALRYSGRIDFILAIGGTGVQWFLDAGYPPAKVYSYGYFVETPATGSAPIPRGTGPVRLVYLGQCVHRKGVDVLVDALAGLVDLPWHLEVIGDGAERAHLEEQSGHLRLEDRISFLGSMPYEQAMQKVQVADLLVLPSRHDGWGAVVNDALMRGTPVICTDRCGSSVLLREPSRGEIVPAGSVKHLKSALARFVCAGPKTPDQARLIINWSEAITGESASSYLLEIIQAVENGTPRPVPPWEKVMKA